MASTFTPRYPLAQQDGLPELLHQLPAHLEGASLESLEQETRHALKRLAVAVSLDDVVLLTFDLEQRTPRAPKIVGTNGAIPEHVAALISHKWLLDRIAEEGAAVYLAPRGPATDEPAAELQQLWDDGTCAVVVASWKTSEDKPAGSILCFQGRTHQPSLVEHESLFITFARRLGSVVLGGAPAHDPADGDRSARERPEPPQQRTPAPVTSPEDGIIGESVSWRYVMFRVEQVADTQATVLLLGGNGHGQGARRARDSSPEHAPAQPLRRAQLLGASGNADRK
jgi:transcriptional regulator with GAF, ATPase, and Fis domain